MKHKHTYILVSSSPSLIRQKIDAIIKENEFQDAMQTQYDLEECSLYQLLEDVDTISFLTPKKVIIGQHCKFLEGKDDRIKEEEIEHLLYYIEHPEETVLLILTATQLDARKKINKTFEKQNLIIKIDQNQEAIMRESFKGYQVENGVFPLLLEYCGEEQERLVKECEKLKLYDLENKKITKELVKNLGNKMISDKDNLAFALVRSIAQKQKQEAFQTLEKLKECQVDFFSIWGLLESQYRLLYQISFLQKKNYSIEKMAKELEVHPFRIKKTLELLSYYSMKEISTFLKYLEEIDYKIKSGQIEESIMLELLIFKL